MILLDLHDVESVVRNIDWDWPTRLAVAVLFNDDANARARAEFPNADTLPEEIPGTRPAHRVG